MICCGATKFLPTRRTIITRAAALCLKHPLRGFDAIHLASGLQLQDTLVQQGTGVDALPSPYVTQEPRHGRPMREEPVFIKYCAGEWLKAS